MCVCVYVCVCISVVAVDIDNDGDIDVISASNLDSKIAWYENTDGLGTFVLGELTVWLSMCMNALQPVCIKPPLTYYHIISHPHSL